MRVVALVSGGKDSCYNMLQCVAAGHDIVALANLQPENKDELDSFMYQTVGHQGIQLYAEAMDLPLFRQSTHGVAVQQDQVYTPTAEDEVEDLYQLLRTVKEEVDIDGVAVGAILSDYQRIRVENVCNRLGLIPLAYLWRRNQEELLQEMIDCEISAIVIKVAALGLNPAKHLGITLADLQPHIVKMKEKYGLNVCGEGGEYETFTLDCPLFNKTIIIDEWETVIHSNDAIAPVGYLNFKNFHLVQKDSVDPEQSMRDRLLSVPVKTWKELISDLDEDVTEKKPFGRGEGDEDSVEEGSSIAEDRVDAEEAAAAAASAAASPATVPSEAATPDPTSADVSPSNPEAPALRSTMACSDPLQVTCETVPLPDAPRAASNDSGWTWFGGIVGQGDDAVLAMKEALDKLSKLVQEQALEMTDLVSMSLYVRDMAQYADMNAEYIKVFKHANPPVRACVEVPLPPETPLVLEGLAFRPTAGVAGDTCTKKFTMHVQSVSHWAPANIGPYSQAVRVGDIIYVAGQIPLVPGTMQLVSGGARKQCRLALRHVGRIVRGIDANTQLRDVVQGICYVTHPSYIPEARREWEKRTNNAIVDYVVVPRLPRSALLEWHIWAHRHNNRFEYEETGCCIGDFRVSIRRRWNYENNVSAVVCYVSNSGTGSLSTGLEAGDSQLRSSNESTPALTPQPPEEMSDEHLSEVICYTLAKLLRKADAATVCNIRFFYKVGAAPSPERIHTVLAHAEGFNIVHSIVPVCQLHNAHTFLSICGVRHN